MEGVNRTRYEMRGDLRRERPPGAEVDPREQLYERGVVQRNKRLAADGVNRRCE